MQHAHQRGVIHRDLKPGNILVAEVDGRAQPHVLDFGIAKPIGGPARGLAADARACRSARRPTWRPSRRRLEPVDTRADVYALGALLYELVAGRPPIDRRRRPARRRCTGSARACRRPRAVVRAAQHGLATRAARAFARDLDAILAKALEKPPERRYATVGAFAEDLRRLLGERADRGAPADAGATAPRASRGATALAGRRGGARGRRARPRRSSGSSSACSRPAASAPRRSTQSERAARDQPLPDRRPARRRLARPRRGRDHGARAARPRQRQIDERFPDRPLIAASIHHTLGEAYAELGEFDDAERHVARALELRRAAAGADAPDTVRSEIAAASLLARRQRSTSAEAALRAAIARAAAVLGPARHGPVHGAQRPRRRARERSAAPAEALAAARGGAGRALAPARARRAPRCSRRSTTWPRPTTPTARPSALARAPARRRCARCEARRRGPALHPARPRATTSARRCRTSTATREAAPYLRARRRARRRDARARTTRPRSRSRATWPSLEAELGNVEHALELCADVVAGRTAQLGADGARTR